jgi:hypothetical protein
MFKRKVILTIILTIFWFSNTTSEALAASGLPDSPEFGYGASISTIRQGTLQVLGIAPGLGLDWISIDFDWSRFWPSPEVGADISILRGLVEAAQQNHLHVLMSISHPPAWAMTPTGPNPDATAAIATQMVSSFQGSLLVVELFPGANTGQGWGAVPNPQAYIEMIQIVRNTLSSQNLQAFVVPSLSPLSDTPAAGDINDLSFLEEFYKADMPTPIIGLRYQKVTDQPITEPLQDKPAALRHYELVRKFMLANGHKLDLIWITGFSWPEQLTSYDEQASWVYDAYKLLKAQLYIGAAFFNSLTPTSPEETFYHPSSLVLEDGSFHPAAAQIQRVTSNIDESVDTSMALTQNQTKLVKKHMHRTLQKRPSS